MDLLNLGKSKLREAILRLYFVEPDNEYYLRQLEKILKATVGNIRRELLNLKKAGIFLSHKKGRLDFYYLDKKYPLFNELKQIVNKTIGLVDEIKKEIAKIKGIETAFIYGPIAKGENNLKAEVFIFIIGQPDKKKISGSMRTLEKKLKRKINIYSINRKEFIFKKDIKDFFIFDLLKRPKIFLVGDKNINLS
ncbi:MAG: hypothetical protein PHX78_06815 [bacterium]|nr:hypothetical protein [bacterium]